MNLLEILEHGDPERDFSLEPDGATVKTDSNAPGQNAPEYRTLTRDTIKQNLRRRRLEQILTAGDRVEVLTAEQWGIVRVRGTNGNEALVSVADLAPWNGQTTFGDMEDGLKQIGSEDGDVE